MKTWMSILAVLVSFSFLMDADLSFSGDIPIPARVGIGSPQFRAITGVSMGGYGAMNTGLTHPNTFKTVACLGGPLDMDYLLKFIEVDLLGNYDSPDIYPSRSTALNMLKDLTISFGNPVYYNPQSTYYPPGITADNARVPTTLHNFFDGKLRQLFLAKTRSRHRPHAGLFCGEDGLQLLPLRLQLLFQI